MTPLQFAKQECANYREGLCSGIAITDEGRLLRFQPVSPCTLPEGKACIYFERWVLPMGNDKSTVVGLARAKEQEEAKWLYYHETGRLNISESRRCPVCGQREVQARERMCYVCRELRRRQTYRQATAKHRVTCQQLSQKTAQNTEENEGVFRGREKIHIKIADSSSKPVNCGHLGGTP